MKNKILYAAIINYNGAKTLLNTVESIYASEEIETKIFIIDDCSTDNSLELLKEKYPEIEIIRQPVNTRNINTNRNIALREAKSERLLLTDNDIVFDKRALYELNKAMDEDENCATCTPRLMFWDEPDRVYTDGTKVHYIGGAISDNRNKIKKKFPFEIKQNSGGGILLIDRKKAIEAGGYDEDVIMMGWGDDGEFYQRLLRYGYNCWYVSSAFALHEDKVISGKRSYRSVGQVYNRRVLILSHYSTLSLILLAPALIIYELIQLIFLTAKKMLRAYFEGNRLIIKNFSKIIEKRKVIQSRRNTADKFVIHSGQMYIDPVLLKNPFINILHKLMNGFLNFYWEIISIFLKK